MIESRLKNRILILDGAMGTMIMKASLSEDDFRGDRFPAHPVSLKGCNDILNISKPELISSIHREYLRAGADIISTNTFNSNLFSLSEYHLSELAPEIAEAGARLARKVVDEFISEKDLPGAERPMVAGSMGPTGISLSISLQNGDDPVKAFEDMAEAYARQATALIKGEVDLLLLETIFDTLNAKAAVYGIKKAFRNTGKEIPLMISATLTENGHLISGQDLKQFLAALAHARPLSFGLNCGFGAKALLPHLRQLSKDTDRFVSLHPNAGLPDAMGTYLDTPDIMQQEVEECLKEGLVNIIGGCCGTTPGHIARIAHIASKYPPRQLPEITFEKRFIKVGERCNVAGSRKFLRLVSEQKWQECVDIAAGQKEKGAAVLDINMDDGMLDTRKSMKDFILRLNADHRTASVPLMIDSSEFRVIKDALRMMPLKGIVNSISLKNGESEFLSRAIEIYSLGASMVVMAFDEKGQADTFERRVEICSRAYYLLTQKAAVNPNDIIFDPNVLAVATGISDHDDYALDFIRTTEWIKHNLPHAHVSGGISNLSFSFRGIDPVRKAMHSVFLEHNIAKGMDMAIINPATPLSSGWIESELRSLVDDVIMNRSSEAANLLVNFAMKLKDKLEREKAAKKAAMPQTEVHKSNENKTSANQRLRDKLFSGDTSGLEEELHLALEECDGSALAVVENGLMRGMDKVGEMFGRGEMFLPQVVRSASFMKKAVDILTPFMEKSPDGEEPSALRPSILLATVKGDVHDIGKNIVAVVLKCSGFEVVDLGVMVDPWKIIDSAIELKVAAIGLSGLITPSLHEMAVVAKMMEEHEMSIPLFIGGATTSALHTAVKIAPLYSGAVIHTSDAASLPNAIKTFIATDCNSAIDELKRVQDKLRKDYLSKKDNEDKGSLLTVEEALEQKTKVFTSAPEPKERGRFDIKIPIADLVNLINWREFLYEWRLNPSVRNKDDNALVINDEEERKRLLEEAEMLLQELVSCNVNIDARVVISGCHRLGDDIILDSGLSLPMLRSQRPNPVKGTTISMSDFIGESKDHIGLFAVTLANTGIPDEIARKKRIDPFRSILLQSLSHRLAEAATERMHHMVKKQIWGYENAGIRPAVGYASLPDQSLVFLLDKELDYSSMGILVTPHGALYPSATTTGLIIANPAARYFEVGDISKEAFEDYARRRNITPEELKPFFPKS